jgi:hypothetical protein
MFLIKRPFFRRQSIRGRAYIYGKTTENEEEEFCEEIGRAEAASGAQGSRQEGPTSEGYVAAGGLKKERAWHRNCAAFAEIQTTDHRVACDSVGSES